MKGKAQVVISARGLSKWYGEVIGLNTFNLEVRPGITGIVGPNGSGKSTFFKLICGMIKASTGEISVLGERPWRNPELMGRLGLCPDYDNLPDDLTGTEFLNFSGGMHGMSGPGLKARVEEVAAIVGMTAAMDRKIGGYSRGMRQRMKIAAAVLHNPELILLDEPLSGTDPLARKDLIDLVISLNREHGHSIVVSSHVLFEIERMTHEVALIYKGRAVATGDISDIRGLIDRHPHNIIVECSDAAAMARRLVDESYVVSVAFNADRTGIIVQVSRPEEFFNDLPGIVSRMECEITRMYSLDDNLEAVFKYLVGW